MHIIMLMLLPWGVGYLQGRRIKEQFEGFHVLLSLKFKDAVINFYIYSRSSCPERDKKIYVKFDRSEQTSSTPP